MKLVKAIIKPFKLEDVKEKAVDIKEDIVDKVGEVKEGLTEGKDDSSEEE